MYFFLRCPDARWALVCVDSAAVCVLLQLFVYTCAKKEYAEKILNILDPQRKLFRYVSSRTNLFAWLHSQIYHTQPASVCLLLVPAVSNTLTSGHCWEMWNGLFVVGPLVGHSVQSEWQQVQMCLCHMVRFLHLILGCVSTFSVNLTVYYWGFSYDYIKSFLCFALLLNTCDLRNIQNHLSFEKVKYMWQICCTGLL